MEDQEQQFIRGFNSGYQLSKYDPILLHHLMKLKTNDSEFFKALAFGVKQHERDKILEKSNLSKVKNQIKDKNR